MAIKLSNYFTLEEFTHSDIAKQEGIDNTPTASEVVELTRLHDNVMIKIRKSLGVTVITSGFRSKKLNSSPSVKGSSSSQHCKGQACDFVVKGQSLNAVFNWCKKNLVYDQLILEPSWVHISFNIKNNRRQSMKYVNGSYVQA